MSTKNSEKYGGYLYATIYGGFWSTLTHLYRMSGKMMYGGFKKEPDQSMSWTKIVVAANKKESGACIYEGKREMSFEVYKRLYEELYNIVGDEHCPTIDLWRIDLSNRSEEPQIDSYKYRSE